MTAHTTTDAEKAAAWLASTHSDPKKTREEWAYDRTAVLPLGVRFTAVRIPADLVHAAVASDVPATVSSVLAELLAGPVIHDAVSHRYYAITTGLDMAGWRPMGGAVLVGRGTWLGVPPVGRTTPQHASYWAVPMRAPRDTCERDRVADLVALGQQRITAVAERTEA